MDVSLFLAELWGWYLLTFFILIMVYPRRIKQLFDFSEDDRFSILVSFILIVLGLASIVAHNLWVTDWRLIITLLGWFTFIKGVVIFAFPDVNKKWLHEVDFKWFQFLVFLFFILGIFLLNQAYQWVPY